MVKTASIPRTLRKSTLRNYFGVTTYSFKYLITEEIINKMGLTIEEHNRIRTYNTEQTKVIIEELEITEEELREMGGM